MQRYDLFLIRKIFGDFFRFDYSIGLNLFVYAGYMTDRKKLKIFFKKSVSNKKIIFFVAPQKSGIIPLKISKKHLGNIWQHIVGANRDMSRKCTLWCFFMRI